MKADYNGIRNSIVVIAGPTGSGKSALAISLAKDPDLPVIEIVNADSRQIYRGMDIGTDKVSEETRRLVPHHMIDIVEPDCRFSVAEFVATASLCIQDIADRGKMPVVVGGTGLYIRALTGGLAGLSGPNPDSREKYRRYVDENGSVALHQLLQRRDFKRASDIHPSDTYRVIRALEILDGGLDNLSGTLNRHGFEDRPYRFLKCILNVEREKLYTRIDARVDQMMKNGLVGEVLNLRNIFGQTSPGLNAIGYSQIGHSLDGFITIEEAARIIRRDTRHYAKRQITWFRKEPDSIWINHDPDNPLPSVEKMTNLIRSFYEQER